MGAPVDRVRSCFEGVRCEIPAALPCFALNTMRVAKRFPTLRLRRPRISLDRSTILVGSETIISAMFFVFPGVRTLGTSISPSC